MSPSLGRYIPRPLPHIPAHTLRATNGFWSPPIHPCLLLDFYRPFIHPLPHPSFIPCSPLSLTILGRGLVSILYKDYWKPASQILNTVHMYICIYVCDGRLCLVVWILSGINASKEVGLVVNWKGKLNLCLCLVICYHNSGRNDSTWVDNKYFYNVAIIQKNKNDSNKKLYSRRKQECACLLPFSSQYFIFLCPFSQIIE